MQRKYLIVVLCTLLSVIFFFGHRGHKLFYVNLMGKTIYFPLINTISHIKNILKSNATNKELSDIIAKQQLTIINLENKIHACKDFDMSVNLSEIDSIKFATSEVVGYSGNYKEKNIIINKGLIDSMEINFPVLHKNGLVGKIISSTINSSTILPLINSTFRCAIMNKKNRVQGMLENNQNANKTYMKFITLEDDIAIGDTIITSNLSTIFPKGIPVGTISEIIKKPGETLSKAEIKPFVKISNLEQVFILFYKEKINNEGNDE